MKNPRGQPALTEGGNPMLRKFGFAAKLSALLATGLLGLYACSSGPTGPESVGRGHSQYMQDETPALLDGIDLEAAYDQPRIDVAARPTGGGGAIKKAFINFAESNEDFELDLQIKNWLIVAQKVGPEGGDIVFGSDRMGYSRIHVPAGALDEEVTITLVHKLRGKRDIFLFPEGQTFNVPIEVRFSLASLNKRQADKLLDMRLYYHNPLGGGWELVPSYSTGTEVVATLDHFSRYAIGSDQ